ncbi:hypothetical protein CPB84DRAFT_1764893 [Gymnopilus junonius]|uniref:Uncharacterized protein n=1 Tax=Gymnopilus junonius TaxID=109634 RepID=A0A9P5TSA5_GYMJU|nr:hypothetical protein CPB84DRAFT_1764893 [Gymnopilus junonius]
MDYNLTLNLPSPYNSPFTSFLARVAHTLMLCTDKNFGGKCVFMHYSGHECINVPNNINDQISSVAPAGSGHSCTLCRDKDCGGPTFTLGAPIELLNNFNDQMSSFRCSS